MQFPTAFMLLNVS